MTATTYTNDDLAIGQRVVPVGVTETSLPAMRAMMGTVASEPHRSDKMWEPNLVWVRWDCDQGNGNGLMRYRRYGHDLVRDAAALTAAHRFREELKGRAMVFESQIQARLPGEEHG